MSSDSSANYGGRQPNNSAYIKHFMHEISTNLWKMLTYVGVNNTTQQVVTTFTDEASVYVQNDLFVDGHIYTMTLPMTSSLIDINEESVEKIKDELSEMIVSSYADVHGQPHYALTNVQTALKNKPDTHVSGKSIVDLNDLVLMLLVNQRKLTKQLNELKDELLSYKTLNENRCCNGPMGYVTHEQLQEESGDY